MHRLLYQLQIRETTVQQNIILFGGLLLLLFAIIYLVFILLARKKQNELIIRQKNMKEDFINQLALVRSEVQDETLNFLSKEVHDNVGQLLNSTKMLLNVAQREIAVVPNAFKMAEETLGNAIQELRALSHSMSTDWIQQFNLIENLSIEVDRINRSSIIEITLSINKVNILLSTEKQLILFRIIQESLQNVLKHAKASAVKIDFTQTSSTYCISISDNGTGIDLKRTKSGIGIQNIKHRVSLLGGSVYWENQNGTIINIDIPFQYE